MRWLIVFLVACQRASSSIVTTEVRAGDPLIVGLHGMGGRRLGQWEHGDDVKAQIPVAEKVCTSMKRAK